MHLLIREGSRILLVPVKKDFLRSSAEPNRLLQHLEFVAAVTQPILDVVGRLLASLQVKLPPHLCQHLTCGVQGGFDWVGRIKAGRQRFSSSSSSRQTKIQQQQQQADKDSAVAAAAGTVTDGANLGCCMEDVLLLQVVVLLCITQQSRVALLCCWCHCV